MPLKKWLGLLLLIAIVMIGLSACSSSLKKPTGLEIVPADSQVSSDGEVDGIFEDQSIKEDEGNQPEISLKEKDLTITDEDSKNKDEPKAQKQTKQSTENSAQSGKIADHQETNKQDNQASTTRKKINQSQGSNHPPTKPASNPSKGASKKEETKGESKPASSEKTEQPKPAGNVITLSIVISNHEVPLPPTSMHIKTGDSVLQALIQITRDKKIQMDYRGGQGATAYVEGIANVYEFDRGQGSGWMYKINGVFPDRGAGVVILCEGDIVEWVYTTNLGQDLGADLKPIRRDGTCP